MNKQKHLSESLDELINNVGSAIPHAKSHNYSGIRFDVSLDVARELIKAVEYYQEPKFFGWPLSLVELYLVEEERIPEQVFRAYQEHINSLVEDNESNEEFFIDEEYETK